MIDFIDVMCTEWGMTRYYIDNCSANPSSIWGRMREGWSIAAAEHSERPCPPEVMLNGALAVSVAIKTAIKAKNITERQFQVLYVHYVERTNTKRKMAAVKLSRARYYDILHRVHRVIRYHLPSDKPSISVPDTCPVDELTPKLIQAA